MTFATLVLRSLLYFWRTNLAVVLGVAAAVSVLAGALLVGDSVRGSLREIAVGRLGLTDVVVRSAGFFREELADDLRAQSGAAAAAPLVLATGFVTHEPSDRRASNVLVYGVDARFWQFHGRNPVDGVYVSPALADELGAADGDVLLTRLQRPSEVPVESLFGRKEDIGRTVRLRMAGVLPREQLGEFSLEPAQGEVRAVFAPLQRIQRDLDVRGNVNTVLLAGAPAADGLRAALQLEDLGIRVSMVDADTTRSPDSEAPSPTAAIVVEHASGIVNQALESAARETADALGLEPIPVFTYLANTIRCGGREVPYSLITATALDELAPEPEGGVESSRIVLNEWAARELEASPGDRVEIVYYVWDPAAGLQTRGATFQLDRVVPIQGLAADRRLAPEYPGITGSDSLADWDPPFPIDLSRVRKQDEDYWDQYRTTPKAFIEYERGRELWQSRYGALTSLRMPLPPGADAGELAERVRRELGGRVSPQAMGVTVYPARQAALEASTGATDFGEYFTYFSFFLVVSALLLAVLFFKLGIEQRLKQVGILRSAGYSVATIRRLLVGEAVILAVAGALLGMAGAVAYGSIIMYGLRTWWVGAVGTTLLSVHVTPGSLALGAAGGVLAAVLCVVLSLRAVPRLSPRLLLTAPSLESESTTDPRRSARRGRLALICGALGVALLVWGFVSPDAQAGAFFGAGAAMLIAALLSFGGWLRARNPGLVAGQGSWAVARLGFRGSTFRPSRSVLSAALIASAVFTIVSVDAFRRGGGELTAGPRSGSGGYVLLAQSELPLLHDPNDPSGREELLIDAPEMAGARFTRFRVRQGQDASCLNLYRPTNPTIIAPEPGFLEAGRFEFADSLAETDAERANPWLLLKREYEDGTIPVIADATSLQYVLHAGIGDTLSIDTGGERPVILRFAGALRDSVLQGQLVMAEEHFMRLFPAEQGYRFFLIEDPSVTTVAAAGELAGVIERELEPFGVDAVTTVERLEAFHRVENTYLSTFQALGGLGLLLGTVGLAAVMFRNVLERRRELALLRAVGYNARQVSLMIVSEAALLLGVGLATGAACAALAIAPAWLGRSGGGPGLGLVLLLASVLGAGLVASLLATRAALAGTLLDALRAE